LVQTDYFPSPIDNRPQHTPGGHILAVGADADLEASIAKAVADGNLHMHVTVVEDYLMALGHLATEKDKPNIIIGLLDKVPEPTMSTATALRRLCPYSRLMLVAGANDQSRAAAVQQAGFDDCLIAPIETSMLADLFSRVLTQRSDDHKLRSAQASKQSVLREVRSGIFAEDLAQQVAAHSTEGELGDIDLVDHLLTSDQDIVPLAMGLLADHASIVGIAWTPVGKDVPEDHLSVRIDLRGKQFGWLYAPPPATRQALAPWAGWLARWLAIEQRCNQLWDLALHDELTGVYNRRYLNRFLEVVLKRARHDHFGVTVLVFDIDDFKLYNDRYGHGAGDEILQETAKLMTSVVRDQDVVARMGGDEFAVVFWDAEAPRRANSEHPATIRKAAQRFQRAICQHRFPKLAEQALDTLTISGGIAGYPWDGQSVDQLLAKADEMTLQSKRQGKNVITFGPGAQRVGGVISSDPYGE